ncbi:MAG: PilZ domain-containing protein [Planctomycetota bacterium]
MIQVQELPSMAWMPAELQAAFNVFAAAETPSDSRRDNAREAYVAPATFVIGRIRRTVYLRDLSDNAAGFLATEAFDPDTQGTLIFNDKRGVEREVSVTVGRCRSVVSHVNEGYFSFAN